MEKDFQSGLEVLILPNRPSGASGGEERQLTAHTVYSGVGELLTSTGTIVEWWKEYFEDLFNPTNTHSLEKTEPEGSEVGALMSGAEVAEAVKQLRKQRCPWGG
ncbi:hypothetical protein L3Q82_003833 [Scortum barcoo]|uniref:Uncharacterized protein n=1 Tax=Scortum barcoo TaxID=214431 RepID=A0ACB8X9B5_9TELE|nr:hypothetical protein L3Q82_003833 [Scortum barcoo]